MTHRLRSHDLDWLRLLAIMLLIPFHSAAVFYEGELGSFYVVNAERSVGLSMFVQFVHQWHRPLFFFLAGAASWYSLQTRSQGEYLRQRLRRLLLTLGSTHMLPERAYSVPYMVYQAFRGFNSWCWILALLALARPYRSYSHPILSDGNRAAFWVYLLHQPLIVIIAFFVVPLSLAILATFVLISLASLVCSLGLHEGLMRL